MEKNPKSWKEIRNAVIEERGHECQRCGEHHPHPHVHHITPRRAFRNSGEAHSTENLVVLCPSCHPIAERLSLRLYPPPPPDWLNVSLVSNLLRSRIVGKRCQTIDATINETLPNYRPYNVKQLVDDMVANPSAPIEAYGGQRDAIRLTSVERAIAYLEEHDGNVPFGFD